VIPGEYPHLDLGESPAQPQVIREGLHGRGAPRAIPIAGREPAAHAPRPQPIGRHVPVQHREGGERVFLGREKGGGAAADRKSRDQHLLWVDAEIGQSEDLTDAGHDVPVVLGEALGPRVHQPGAGDADGVGGDHDHALSVGDRAQPEHGDRALPAGSVEEDEDGTRLPPAVRRGVVGAMPAGAGGGLERAGRSRLAVRRNGTRADGEAQQERAEGRQESSSPRAHRLRACVPEGIAPIYGARSSPSSGRRRNRWPRH